MIHIGLGLTQGASRGGRRPIVVDAVDWTARAAAVGDEGHEDGAPRRLDLRVEDDGRLFVSVALTAPGEWGVLIAPAGTPAIAIGEPADGVIAFGLGASSYLGGSEIAFRPASVQLCHRADATAPWRAASTARGVSAAPRAAALAEADTAFETFVVLIGTVGVRVAVPILAADALWWTRAPAPAPQDWVPAVAEVGASGLAWRLEGLENAPGTVLTDLRLTYATPTLKAAPASPPLAFALPALPAAFDAAGATLVDQPSPGGDRLTLTVAAAPVSDLPLSSIEAQLSTDGVLWGATLTFPPAEGTQTLVALAGVPTQVRLRAISALGVGAWRVFGPATPTLAAPAATLALQASRLSVVEGEAVHFAPDDSALAAWAATLGLATQELRRRASYVWAFSVGDQREDYAFEALPTDHRGRRTAGHALGCWAGHAYLHAGVHTVRLTARIDGAMAMGTIQIAVAAEESVYSGARTAVLDLAATPDFSGKPTDAVELTDVDAAFAWLSGGGAGDRRRLLLKRGQTVALTPVTEINTGKSNGRSVPSGCRVGAWGQGPRPVLSRHPSWSLIGVPALLTTGDGVRASFPLTSAATHLAVYVGGRATAAFTRGATEIVFQTPPAAGAEIRVQGCDALTTLIDRTADGATTSFAANADVVLGALPANVVVEVAGAVAATGWSLAGPAVVFVTPPAAGQRVRVRAPQPFSQETYLLRCNSSAEVVVRDLSFRGDNDPENPSIFDGTSLASFGHDFVMNAIQAQGLYRDFTVLRCDVAGLRNGVQAIDSASEAGQRLAMVDFRVDGWGNYGAYTGYGVDQMQIGCDFRQRLAVRNLGGPKSENIVGQPNDSDHGPLRTPGSIRQVLNACRFDSRNSWSSQSFQPVTRLATSDAVGLGYSMTECDMTGGDHFWGGGAPNQWVPFGRTDLIYVAHNVFEGCIETVSFGQCVRPYTSMNNLYLMPDVPQPTGSGNLVMFQGSATGDDGELIEGARRVVAPTVSLEPPLSINDSFVIRQSRPAASLVVGQAAVLQSSGVVCRVGSPVTVGAAPTTVVTFTNAKTPDYNLGASWWLVFVNRAAYDGVTTDGAARAAYSVATSGTTQTVTFLKGAVPAGAEVILTRTPVFPGVIDQRVFYENNRATPIVLPGPVIHNPLMVVGGSFASVRLLDGGGAYTPQDFAPLSALGQPETGSPALEAATGVVAPLDFRGAARPASAAVGALELGTDLTGFRAPIETADATVAWSNAVTAGQVLGTAGGTDGDVRPVITISPTGSPALTVGNIALVVTANGVPVAPGHVFETGDAMVATARWGHLAGRPQTRQATSVVQPSVFAPTWIRNGTALDPRSCATPLLSEPGPSNDHAGPFAFAIRLRWHSFEATNTPLRGIITSAIGSTLRWSLNTRGSTLRFSSAVNVDTAAMTVDTPYSFLILADPGKSLPGGRSVEIYRDGALAASSTATINPTHKMDSYQFMSTFDASLNLTNPSDASFREWLWYGPWTAGSPPAYADFFDATTHEVKNLGGLGVVGRRTPFVFYLGASTLNAGTNLGSRPNGTTPRLAGKFYRAA